MITVRERAPDDQGWIEQWLASRWGGVTIYAHGRRHDAACLPALIAGRRDGLATYLIESAGAELVTLDAAPPWRGTGTALLAALVDRLTARDVRRLFVTTSNDNLDALRFYQRRGFHLLEVRPGALAELRKLKPSIPLIGAYGIPIRDEIRLVRRLAPARGQA
jgi:GNAT superfamily N-acetyltransferase